MADRTTENDGVAAVSALIRRAAAEAPVGELGEIDQLGAALREALLSAGLLPGEDLGMAYLVVAQVLINRVSLLEGPANWQLTHEAADGAKFVLGELAIISASWLGL
jgi:hypothetical protein